MRKEWYFRTLLIVFALLVVMQQQTVVPNQEIVLEFANAKVTSLEVQDAIATVKRQLESIGVKNARISKELRDGKLKIAYYSDADVESIKRILSNDQNVTLDHVFYNQNNSDDSLPIEKKSADYNLDVYKIQKSTDFDTDFHGVYVLEIKHKQDRASGYYTFGYVTDENSNNTNRLLKLAKKVNDAIVIAIDTISYKIPEVRAGPIT